MTASVSFVVVFDYYLHQEGKVGAAPAQRFSWAWFSCLRLGGVVAMGGSSQQEMTLHKQKDS